MRIDPRMAKHIGVLLASHTGHDRAGLCAAIASVCSSSRDDWKTLFNSCMEKLEIDAYASDASTPLASTHPLAPSAAIPEGALPRAPALQHRPCSRVIAIAILCAVAFSALVLWRVLPQPTFHPTTNLLVDRAVGSLDLLTVIRHILPLFAAVSSCFLGFIWIGPLWYRAAIIRAGAALRIETDGPESIYAVPSHALLSKRDRRGVPRNLIHERGFGSSRIDMDATVDATARAAGMLCPRTSSSPGRTLPQIFVDISETRCGAQQQIERLLSFWTEERFLFIRYDFYQQPETVFLHDGGIPIKLPQVSEGCLTAPVVLFSCSTSIADDDVDGFDCIKTWARVALVDLDHREDGELGASERRSRERLRQAQVAIFPFNREGLFGLAEFLSSIDPHHRQKAGMPRRGGVDSPPMLARWAARLAVAADLTWDQAYSLRNITAAASPGERIADYKDIRRLVEFIQSETGTRLIHSIDSKRLVLQERTVRILLDKVDEIIPGERASLVLGAQRHIVSQLEATSPTKQYDQRRRLLKLDEYRFLCDPIDSMNPGLIAESIRRFSKYVGTELELDALRIIRKRVFRLYHAGPLAPVIIRSLQDLRRRTQRPNLGRVLSAWRSLPVWKLVWPSLVLGSGLGFAQGLADSSIEWSTFGFLLACAGGAGFVRLRIHARSSIQAFQSEVEDLTDATEVVHAQHAQDLLQPVGSPQLGRSPTEAAPSAQSHRHDRGSIESPLESPAPDDLTEAPVLDHVAMIDKAPMVFIGLRGGRFLMGSEGARAAVQEETPAHPILLSRFSIAATPVTVRQYEEVMGTATVSLLSAQAVDWPMHNVTWFEAIEFCNRLSRLEGLTPCYTIEGEECRWDTRSDGYRLPTEAEWEYSCRAGSRSEYSFGEEDEFTLRGEAERLTIYAWVRANSGNTPHDVRGRPPNAWGLYDMHGNVWEWCWDWYSKYSPRPRGELHMGPPSGYLKILRGGSFRCIEDRARSAFRSRVSPSERFFDNGFRCVRGPYGGIHLS